MEEEEETGELTPLLKKLSCWLKAVDAYIVAIQPTLYAKKELKLIHERIEEKKQKLDTLTSAIKDDSQKAYEANNPITIISSSSSLELCKLIKKINDHKYELWKEYQICDYFYLQLVEQRNQL